MQNKVVNFNNNHKKKCLLHLRYLVYIDENGDAAGNYTLLSIKSSQNNSNEHGLYPIGTFNAPQLIEIPVSFNDFIECMKSHCNKKEMNKIMQRSKSVKNITKLL